MIVISKSKTVTSSNKIVEVMMRQGYDSRYHVNASFLL